MPQGHYPRSSSHPAPQRPPGVRPLSELQDTLRQRLAAAHNATAQQYARRPIILDSQGNPSAKPTGEVAAMERLTGLRNIQITRFLAGGQLSLPALDRLALAFGLHFELVRNDVPRRGWS